VLDEVKVESKQIREELVARIVDSPLFERAPRLRSFLTFICSEAENGRGGHLSEQVIGEKVFGRDSGYSTADDTIVRVTARAVRDRLRAYFEGPGAKEPWLIEVPKGGYSPVFLERVDVEAAPAVADPAPVALEFAPVLSDAPTRRGLMAGLVFGGAALGAAATWWTMRSPPAAPLWRQIFDGHSPVLVVAADSVFASMQDMAGRNFTLDEYSNRLYLQRLETLAKNKEIDPILPRYARRQYTSVADLLLTNRLMQAHGHLANRITVKYARQIEQRDLREGNAVLSGSPQSNPWVRLFEAQLNFQFEPNVAMNLSTVRNRQPGTGELVVYGDGALQARDGYAVVALVRNLSGRGRVLLIGGTGMEETEAAGEWSLDAGAVETALGPRGLIDSQGVRPFEVLLHVKSVAGSPDRSRVVSVRAVKEP